MIESNSVYLLNRGRNLHVESRRNWQKEKVAGRIIQANVSRKRMADEDVPSNLLPGVKSHTFNIPILSFGK